MLVMVWFVVIGCFSGCLFDTRDATPPGDGEPGSTWVTPDLPDKVFLNMDSGLEDLTGTNYDRSLHPTFTFEPLPEDKNNPSLAGQFDDWTVSVEKQVVQKMLSDARDIEVRFITPQQISSSGTTAEFQSDYELTTIDKGAPPDTVSYKGRAQFDFQLGGTGWQITRWEDLERVSGFATWGFLRGSLREL